MKLRFIVAVDVPSSWRKPTRQRMIDSTRDYIRMAVVSWRGSEYDLVSELDLIGVWGGTTYRADQPPKTTSRRRKKVFE